MTPKQLHLFCDRCGSLYKSINITETCPPCYYAINQILSVPPLHRRFIGPTPLIHTFWRSA